jgi:hypothetical protein
MSDDVRANHPGADASNGQRTIGPRMDDQGTNRTGGELSSAAQFFIVACAALGTMYGMYDGTTNSLILGGTVSAVILTIVGVFLFMKRKK